ncbi:MAG: aminotransferase class V-fold PLP-dependent enzyme [Planctomycetota bacterium]
MCGSDATIYLDNNATTPLDPRVLEVMMPYLQGKFGNAASQTHVFGHDAMDAVTRARSQIAKLIGAKADEIVFTSGATESTNLAIKGLAEHLVAGAHLLTVGTEHKATLDTAHALERQGFEVTYLDVDSDGLLDLDDLKSALRPETFVVSVMMANNETGVIAPVAEIGEICRSHGATFHSDAAQAFGKIPIDVNNMMIDLMSVSAHKIYGPKGCGALYVRRFDETQERGANLAEQIHGGGHEGGRRSGTLNVPGIVGLGEAARLAGLEMAEERCRLLAFRDRFLSQIQDGLGAAHININGSMEKRLEGNLNVSFDGVSGETLIMALSKLAVSSGSACNSDTIEPSYVLRGLGLDDERALGAIRFGFGRFNTEQEIDEAAKIVTQAVTALRQMA